MSQRLGSEVSPLLSFVVRKWCGQMDVKLCVCIRDSLTLKSKDYLVVAGR